MRQDDYYLKQIDLLGKILGKIVSDILKTNSTDDVMEGFEAAAQALKNEVGINLNDLLNKNNDEIVTFLQQDKKLNNNHLEKLAEILFELGKEHHSEYKKNLFKKSLTIYSFVNNNSSTYSIERVNKMDKINKILINL
jgi:hypothetical protein